MRSSRPPRALAFLHGCALRSPPVRSLHLARHFADHLPVIYIPYRSPLEWVMGDGRRPPWAPLAGHANVRHVGLPLTTFLSRRSRLAARFHAFLAAHGLRRAMRALRVAPAETLLFVESASAVDVVHSFPDAPVMYDCADDARNWHRTSAPMRRLYGAMEDELAQRASWIVISIPRLAARFAEYPAELLPGVNGVDQEFFDCGMRISDCGLTGPANSAFRNPQSAIPPDLAAVPKPRLLFVGIMSSYLDPDIVAAVADAQVGSVVLVGPVDPRAPVARLRGRPNITWLGRKEYEELPAYLRAADVALIPATRADASDCIPSKLLMYCAAGLPVVARRCSSFEPFGDRLLLADEAPEFVAQIRAALADPGWQREARIALAREHTWDRLAADLLEQAGVG